MTVWEERERKRERTEVEGKSGGREGGGMERVDKEGEGEGRRRMEEGGTEKLEEVRVEEMNGREGGRREE